MSTRTVRRLGPWLLVAALAPCVAAGVVRQLTDVRTSPIERPVLSDDGRYLFTTAAADPLGTNPRHRFQIFRWDLQLDEVAQITTFAQGIEPAQTAPGIDDTGSKVVFVARADLTGANPDQSPELFVMNVDGTGLLQLTDGSGPGEIGGVQMSGNGQRVVFGATFDYLGAAPAFPHQVFVVDVDGANLRQLSDPASYGYFPSISNDGQRVVYAGPNIVGVLADGTGRHDITSWFAWLPAISGDGGTVIFLGTGSLPNESPGWCIDGTQVGAADWDGSNPKKLSGTCLGNVVAGTVSYADVSDDGQTIVYAGSDLFSSVYRVDRNVTVEVALAPWFGAFCERVAVSGDGQQVAFTCSAADPVGANADGSLELFVTDRDGHDVAQPSDVPPAGDSRDAALSADSRQAVFVSDARLLDGPDPGDQLYQVDLDGGALRRLSSLVGGQPMEPVTSADGRWTAFTVELFDNSFGQFFYRIWLADRETGAVTPLTGAMERFGRPDIDDVGSTIVAERRDVTPTIYKLAPDGSGATPLAPGQSPKLDGAGQQVTFGDGGAIRRIGTDGSGLQTLSPFGVDHDLSRSGRWVVFAGSADPLGTNADGNQELFLLDTQSSALTQLTDTTSVINEKPVIGGEALRVFFRRYDGSRTDQQHDLYVIEVSGLAERRVDGLRPCLGFGGERPVMTDATGELAVFDAFRNCAGENPDGNGEIVLADLAATARLFADRATPTLLRWEARPDADRYAVVRGDLDSLSAGGGTIDLGTVVCIEAASVDPTTAGDEDAELPTPGQAFFYLVRAAGESGYGRSSAGLSRTPSAGDCQDP